MRALVVALCCGCLWTAQALAQIQQFPYEAAAQADDVYVRSGPGQKYYPTGKLKLGDRVRVHRHDPGGWYMIAPPAGSFSWIDVGLVKKAGPTRGVVEVPPLATGQTGQAVVWIGSDFSDDHSITGRQLTTGDEVEILGEKQMPTERGRAQMYKIKPPALEYRWVKGDFIVPVSAALQRQAEQDPFATPFAQRQERQPTQAGPWGDGAGEGSVVEREQKRGQRSGTVRAEAGDDSAASGHSRLTELDQQYSVMMGQDPATWRLDELEQEYRALQASADRQTVSDIDSRLAAIAARKQIRAEMQDFLRLTTETTQREMQLLTLQNGGVPPTSMTAPPVQLGAPQTIPSGIPQPASAHNPAAEPIPEHTLPPQRNDPVVPRFDGAGIVQRTGNPIPGLPQHVLLAPDGRLLAYLEGAQGVNLDQHVGQSLALIGQRAYDPRLRADRIVVRRVAPVQLKP